MARKGKAAKPAAAAGTARAPRSLSWLQGLACGALVAIAPGFAVLGAVLGAPCWLAVALERGAGRPVLRSVALATAAAAVGPVRAFWSSGHGMGAAWVLVETPRVVALAWGAGGAGWLLAELCPLGVRLALEATAAGQAGRLRLRRAVLAKRWGLEGG